VNNHRRRTRSLEYLFTEAPTQKAIRGTAWAGVQSIGEYLDEWAEFAADATFDARRSVP
jgi:hypothetical protein